MPRRGPPPPAPVPRGRGRKGLRRDYRSGPGPLIWMGFSVPDSMGRGLETSWALAAARGHSRAPPSSRPRGSSRRGISAFLLAGRGSRVGFPHRSRRPAAHGGTGSPIGMGDATDVGRGTRTRVERTWSPAATPPRRGSPGAAATAGGAHHPGGLAAGGGGTSRAWRERPSSGPDGRLTAWGGAGHRGRGPGTGCSTGDGPIRPTSERRCFRTCTSRRRYPEDSALRWWRASCVPTSRRALRDRAG